MNHRWITTTISRIRFVLDGWSPYLDHAALSGIFIICLLLVACSGEFPPREEISPKTPVILPTLTSDSYPLVDGSTSTSPLGTLIACQMMNVKCTWMDFFDGSRIMAVDMTEYVGEFPQIQHNGTHDAYMNLIDGQADLILVAREPSEDEINYAIMSGVVLHPKVVALDAFVFIVNESSTVDGLSTEDIRDIYTGRITNWKEVGGPDAEVHPYQRNDNSGSQELMYRLVMKDTPIIDAPEMIRLTMIAPFYAISEDPLGIGYSVYYYEEYMAPNEKVKLLAVDGVMPDQTSISDRSYPYFTEVYVVVRDDLPPTSSAYLLRDWLLSAEGQELVEQSGYVPLLE